MIICREGVMATMKRIFLLVLMFSMFAGAVYADECTDGDCQNGQGEMTSPYGKKYIGEFKDGKYDGQGEMTYSHTVISEGTRIIKYEKYVGQWKNGKKNGQGTMAYLYGRKYVGEWKDGKKNGQGTYTNAFYEYTGEFKDGMPNGKGTVIFDGNIKYVGEFKDNKRIGQGTLIYPNGTKQVGEFKDGIRIGQGIFLLPDNGIIDEFEDDERKPTAEELAYEAEKSAYKSDTATILTLLGNIRDFKSNYQDTEVQKKARERKLKEALARINANYKGKLLTLQRAKLDDVTADTVLSTKGINLSRQMIAKLRQDPASAAWVGDGNLQTNDLLAWIVGLQLAFCPDCRKESGKYKATYSIPVPGEQYRYGIAVGRRKNNDDGTTDYEEFKQGLPIGKFDFGSFEYLTVEIVKIYPNENSVINLKKGSVAPLTGKIRGVLYEDAGDKLTILID